jgi:hypothetical protein
MRPQNSEVLSRELIHQWGCAVDPAVNNFVEEAWIEAGFTGIIALLTGYSPDRFGE